MLYQVVHAEDTIDIAGIIAEEDTTKGSKSTHHIGLEGDGGLNAAGVGGGDEAYTSSRHDGGCVASVMRWWVEEMVELEVK